MKKTQKTTRPKSASSFNFVEIFTILRKNLHLINKSTQVL